MTGLRALHAPDAVPMAFIDQWALWGKAYTPALLAKYRVTVDDLKAFMATPHGQALLQERKTYWARQATAEERIKAKARMSVEDAIPRMQAWIEDDEMAPSVRLAVIQELSKLANLPRPVDGAVQAGAALVLNVDFGDGKQVRIDSNPVIESNTGLPPTTPLEELPHE